ncbi:Aste57867_10495 [Aphanomyces stellatus]|uniref:Aste57867_10495 protein n=1 Tax=Aphanomyces stellatus TaxID=120398 RepID=A0A485KQZ5_9STRA|nr:hypothetical protein As57867_010455 [Aphanomyces stellatus]VFT87369.1 Aste57867_10495 [Aphanomyces stellatus]
MYCTPDPAYPLRPTKPRSTVTANHQTPEPLNPHHIPFQCAVDHCPHFAKIERVCLAHFRQLFPDRLIVHGGTRRTRPPSPPSRNRKCQTSGCQSYARSGGFCTRHGGGRRCEMDGCHTAAQTGGFCRLHGGGSKCRLDNCSQFARVRGLCLQHNREKDQAEDKIELYL